MNEKTMVFSPRTQTDSASQQKPAAGRKDQMSAPRTFSVPASSFVPRPVQDVHVKVDRTKLAKALKEVS
jgi:hypothetical protein